MFPILTVDLIESKVSPFDFLVLLLICNSLSELHDRGRLTRETLSLI